MTFVTRLAALLALVCCIAATPRISTWVVVTDIHYNPYADFDIRDGDTSPQLWSQALASLHEQRDADVVLVDGDLLAHHFASLVRAHDPHASPDAQGLRVTTRIVNDLAHAFPRAQFIVTLGNNDDPCGDYHSETTGPYAAALARVWEPLVDRAHRAPEFARAFGLGGYYAVEVPGGRVLALNSVVWSFVSAGSCATDRRDVARNELTWLGATLRSSTRPTALAMHIPPGYDAASTSLTKNFVVVPFLRPDRNAELERTLSSDGKHVTFGVAGHVHRYGYRLLADIPLLVAPPISPIYHNYPAYTVLRVDAALHPTSIVPYVYDPEQERFTARESFERTYDVENFDAASLREASERVWSDERMRARWIAAYDLWTPRMGDIADHDWRFFICAATNTGTGFAQCTHSARLASVPWIIAAVAASVAVAALAIILRRRRRR